MARYLYFRTWQDAKKRAANEGWNQEPIKRQVWFAHESEPDMAWALVVPEPPNHDTDEQAGEG